MDWYHIKQGVELFTGLHMDALHVHAGVLGQVAAAFILRRPLASPLPWLAVLAVVLANEWYDLQYEIWPDRGMQYGESFRDLWNTMLVPTLLLALARFCPSLFSTKAEKS
jgi:hypothetical protein